MEKIYIQMSSYTDDVTGFVMTADSDVTSTALDASSCRYALYIRVCDCRVERTGSTAKCHAQRHSTCGSE